MYIVILFLFISVYIFVPTEMNPKSMIYLLVVLSIAIILFLFRKENNKNLENNYLKLSYLFLLGFIIVHFQYYIDYILGYVDKNEIFIWKNSAIVIKSLFISGIGLLSFLSGYQIFSRNEYKYKFAQNKIVGKEKSVFFLKILAIASLVLFFLTIDFKYFLGMYNRVTIQPITLYSILLFKVLTFVIIIQTNQNLIIRKRVEINFYHYLKEFGWIFILSILIYLVSVITSGDRGPIIIFCLAFIGGYLLVTQHKFKIRFLVIVFLLGSFIMTVLGIARSLDNSNSFFDRILNSMELLNIEPNSISPFTTELAGSVNTLHACVDFVPKYHDYTMGKFQINEVLFSIPFITYFIPELMGEVKYSNSAAFNTWIIQGDNPQYGNGTTIIADLYTEYSLWGVFIGMLIFGYFVRFAENVMVSKSQEGAFYPILALVYYSNSIYISRSSVLFIFRLVSWVLIVYFINKHFFNKN